MLGERTGKNEFSAAVEPVPFEQEDKHHDPEASGREVEEQPGLPEPDKGRREREDQSADTAEQPPDGGKAKCDRDGGGSIFDGGS